MAKKNTTQTLERTYVIPLRKEFRKVANWKQTKKAVKAAKEFLAKHMKSSDVRLGVSVNEELWKHGIKNPPHKVKVVAVKDAEGVVRAELFGAKAEAEEAKAPAKKEVKKAAPKTEEKKPEAEVKKAEEAQKVAETAPAQEKVEEPKATSEAKQSDADKGKQNLH